MIKQRAHRMEWLLLGIISLLIVCSSAEAATYECDSCSSCTSVISGASSNDTVVLNASLSIPNGTCITALYLADVVFDCQGNSITSAGYDADGIVVVGSVNMSIHNCTVSGFNFGFHDYSNSFCTWSDLNATGNYYGLEMDESDGSRILSTSLNNNVFFGGSIQTSSNVLLSDVMAYGNGLSGILMGYITGTSVIGDIRVSSNGQDGFSLWSVQGASFDNITVDSNAGYGMVFDGGSVNNTVNNSHVMNNGGSGLAFGITGGNTENNMIYNNLLNNSLNAFFADDSFIEAWNATQSPGINIVGENVLGGNYWADPAGTGYSEACPDLDTNGICDSPYVISGNNIDYLPLSSVAIAPPPINVTNLTLNDVYQRLRNVIFLQSASAEMMLTNSTCLDNQTIRRFYDSSILISDVLGIDYLNTSRHYDAVCDFGCDNTTLPPSCKASPLSNSLAFFSLIGFMLLIASVLYFKYYKRY